MTREGSTVRSGGTAEVADAWRALAVGGREPAASPPLKHRPGKKSKHAGGFLGAEAGGDVVRLARFGALLRWIMATRCAARGPRWPWVEYPLRTLHEYEVRIAKALDSLGPCSVSGKGAS